MNNSIVRSLTVFIVLGLSLVCFSTARADIPFYLGEKAFKQKDWARALPLFRQARQRDPRNIQTARQLGLTAYQLALETNHPEMLAEASAALEQVTKQAPYDAKGWLYAALTRLELERRASGGIHKENWAAIQEKLEKAQKAEPGSPWISYMAGETLLSQAPLLSDEEKKKAVEWIRKSVSLHHPYQTSPYLDSALAFLWKQFSDFTLLKLITPPDFASYARLVDFVESKGLWEYRDEINPFYLKLKEALYEEYSARGDFFLGKQDFKRALFYYDKAAGTNNVRVRAKAGLLITQKKLDRLGKNWKNRLREVLEEEQDSSGTLYALDALVQDSQEPYLKGIYAYRRQDYPEARRMLEKADGQNKFRRRYLTDTYWRMNNREKAMVLAKAVLEERDPDLRELFTYQTWGSSLEEALSSKIARTVTIEQPAEAWRGAGFQKAGILDHRGRVRVYVNLKPGPVLFRIPMKNQSSDSKKAPYAAVHLWDGDKVYHLSSAYVPHQNWKTLDFRWETTGGSRDLEVELMNGEAEGTLGPVLELGAVQIEYPHA